MTDVVLSQGLEGGEIDLTSGNPSMDDGFRTAAYLSLFGGNADDSGRTEDNKLQWWGNDKEPPERQYRGKTQSFIRTMSMSVPALRNLERLVRDDLAWFENGGFGTLDVTVGQDTPNRVKIVISGIFAKTNVPYEWTFKRGLI